MTIKRVTRTFRNFATQVREKPDHSVVYRPMCLNCHRLKLVSCRQFTVLLTLPIRSLLSNRSGWLAGGGHAGFSHCGAHCDIPSQRFTTTPGKSAAVRALPVSLNQASWFFPHRDARCTKGTADALVCIYYRQHCAKRNAPVFNLFRGRFWGFSPNRGDTLHRLGWNLARSPLLHAKFDLNRCNG